MAFTAAEKLSIGRIIGMTPTLLNAHLTSLGAALTADVETAVRAELTRWGISGAEFTAFTPTESNKGFNLNAKLAKADIRKNIRILLEIYSGYSDSSSIGTLRVS